MDRLSVLDAPRPVIGLLVSESKLGRVLGGWRDRVYCRYARYAREGGAQLIFFARSGLDAETGQVEGYAHRCDLTSACRWERVSIAAPTMIYDRCFGKVALEEALAVREAAARLGCTVVNRPPKVTKIMTFQALQNHPDLLEHLPYTAPLTPAGLAMALERFRDLYLKPDNLYKGKGVYRLTREAGGWLLQHRGEETNESRFLADGEVMEALEPLLQEDARYLMQEGLDLATFGGNRFDFRSLVQKNGRGEWTLTGLVARVGATGSVITSPRSGGQVAPAERALADLFGDRAPDLVAEIERVSIKLAAAAESHFGTCAELGLDVGVTRDGVVKLIEINGKPLRVSLLRLNDPLISERVDRYPIHFAIHVASDGSASLEAPDEGPPRVGVLLGSITRLWEPGPWADRYVRMMREGREAGTVPFVFTAPDVDLMRRRVHGWTEREGAWVQSWLPLPDVVWHRALYADRAARDSVKELLRQLALYHGTVQLNKCPSFTKLDVHTALSFFPATALLSPDTRPYAGLTDLTEMLDRHPVVFVKANEGSHGSEVVRISAGEDSWTVQGQMDGKPATESFGSLDQLHDFLTLTTAGRLWILQQGISLPLVEGRICDLRVILQKDGQGAWQSPLVLLRWGRAGQVAANMSQGGEPFLPADFHERFGDMAEFAARAETVARAAAAQAATALEARFGLLGEVGFDIALDQSGRAWVLEANTKPVHPLMAGLVVPLERYPFQYATYLAERVRAGKDSRLAHCRV